MTIQELRQHQIVVQDPEIDRTEYDAVMNRLRELGEKVASFDYTNPKLLIEFDHEDLSWCSLPLMFRDYDELTFDEFMNLEIETE